LFYFKDTKLKKRQGDHISSTHAEKIMAKEKQCSLGNHAGAAVYVFTYAFMLVYGVFNSQPDFVFDPELIIEPGTNKKFLTESGAIRSKLNRLPYYDSNLSGVIGRSRTRLPVAL
jgi:hypothetical protein